MHPKSIISALALTALALVGFGCSNSGSTSGLSIRGACVDGAFCLTSCSLGCTNQGCSVTDIAPNQPIRLTFSQHVDLTTVDFSTISIKTVNGRTPEGRFVVTDNIVEFKPEIKIIGGKTAFGFIANETYLLNLPDAEESGQVLKSISGDALSTPLVCSLRVSQKIIDLDGAPPKGRLITPVDGATNVPKDTVIVVEFSEIIDIAPFQGATTQTSPVQYLIRKTKQKPGGAPNERVCDQNSNRQALEGLPQAENDSVRGVTTVTLRPTVPLPSQICIEVVVTGQVRDLSGKPAIQNSESFTTQILVAGEGEMRERFNTDGQLDKTISSGSWSGGKALPPRIGGTGVLGEFNISAGKADPTNPNRYVWNTDSQLIPGAFTPTGKDITVTGGIFEFTRFNLGADLIVVFEGSNPAQIRVRGEAIIAGRMEANAPVALYFAACPNPGSPFAFGQQGTFGNCGGARGGQGGDSCLNKGTAPRFIGRTGGVVRLPSGNAYKAQSASTGGKGGPLFPATGKNTNYCALTGVFCGMVGLGGGGGGFSNPGKKGFVTQDPCNLAANRGVSSNTGGGTFDIGSLNRTNKTAPNGSVNFYGVGGSGGGGGGAHPLLSRGFPFDKWLPGSAGAGGGGIIIIRVGGDLTMKGKGTIQVKGGRGYTIDAVKRFPEPNDNLFNVPTPGGGGSGGAILCQAVGATKMAGLLDCSGGDGGILDNTPTNQFGLRAKARGGDGGAGYYRLETPNGPSVIDIGSGIPAAKAGNGGVLTDFESKGVSQSHFYTTKLTFPPTFLRYILEVEINSIRKVYSDDTEVGNPAAKQYDKDYAGVAGPNEPVYLQLQGAKVSTVTGKPDLVTIGPWRDYANRKGTQGLNDDDATGCRFRLTFDSTGTTSLVVKRVSVFFIE